MKKICVFLDLGHCKSTPGKCSPDKSIREYLYNREIVSMIEKRLDELGIDHWNTHPEDDFVPGSLNDSKDLVLRTTRINLKHRDLKKQGITSFLISVHINAAGSGWNNATGWEAYTTKGKTISDKLAECMYKAAEEYLKPINKKIRYNKEADFWILRLSNCACTLTENFFMDNKEDVAWLLSDEGKLTIVNIHIKGILNYINTL